MMSPYFNRVFATSTWPDSQYSLLPGGFAVHKSPPLYFSNGGWNESDGPFFSSPPPVVPTYNLSGQSLALYTVFVCFLPKLFSWGFSLSQEVSVIDYFGLAVAGSLLLGNTPRLVFWWLAVLAWLAVTGSRRGISLVTQKVTLELWDHSAQNTQVQMCPDLEKDVSCQLNAFDQIMQWN